MDDNGTVRYLLTDHLGSTSKTINTNATIYGELRYKAWGENRYSGGTTPTSYHFTGQREESGLAPGLYFYGARWYDSAWGRFLQADTIIPSAGNPQSLNRYSYVLNNPLRYIDPTGRFSEDAIQEYLQQNYPDTWKDMLSSWQSMKDWWATLLQANAGDVLVSRNADGKSRYNRFQGTKQDKNHPDQLTGVVGLSTLPSIGSTEQADNGDSLAGLATATHIALATYDLGNARLAYWNPHEGWTAHFANSSLFAVPTPGQTRPQFGSALAGATLWEATAVLGEAAATCAHLAGASASASSLTVAAGVGAAATAVGAVFFIGTAAWTAVTGWNVFNTPSAWSEW